MTVALEHNCYTVSSEGGVKQFLRRRLPIRARSTHRKRKLLPETHPKHHKDETSRLSALRYSYARRGVSPTPPVEDNREVVEVSEVGLAGAKRSYVQVESPSDCDYHSDSSDTSCITNYPSRVKYVQFASHCVVVEIPHFREYSMRQKAAMWNGTKKIRTMARKNTLEFQFDGWNVDTAAEEDQFVKVAGTPVHPAHALAKA